MIQSGRKAYLEVKILQRGRAEDDEKAHPEGGTLIGDDFIVFIFLGVIVRLENDCIEKQGK